MKNKPYMKNFYISDNRLDTIKENILHYPFIMEFAKIILYLQKL